MSPYDEDGFRGRMKLSAEASQVNLSGTPAVTESSARPLPGQEDAVDRALYVKPRELAFGYGFVVGCVVE